MDLNYRNDCEICPSAECVGGEDFYCYEIDAFVIVNGEPTEHNGDCI